MKAIPSGEKFFDVNVIPPVAPRHTEVGHEKCAYYMEYDRMEGRWNFLCPHMAGATGAFYSEDFVRELKILGQKINAEWERTGQAVDRRLMDQLHELVKD